MQCSGACTATADARTLGKLICSMPRHPEKQPKEFLPKEARVSVASRKTGDVAACGVHQRP